VNVKYVIGMAGVTTSLSCCCWWWWWWWWCTVTTVTVHHHTERWSLWFSHCGAPCSNGTHREKWNDYEFARNNVARLFAYCAA